MSSAPHHVRTHLYPLSLGCRLHQHVLSTWWRKSCQDQVPTLPHLAQDERIVISTPILTPPLHSHPPHTNANRYYIVQGEKDPPLLNELSLVWDKLQQNLSIRPTVKTDWERHALSLPHLLSSSTPSGSPDSRGVCPEASSKGPASWAVGLREWESCCQTLVCSRIFSVQRSLL